MPTKKVTAADREIIADLVTRYSARAVAEAALAVYCPRKGRGRPIEFDPDTPFEVWRAVEVKRRAKKGQNRRHSVLELCGFVKADIDRYTVGLSLSAMRLKNLYYEA